MSVPALHGRVVLVTGGTDGVGRALVQQVASAGATTLLTARDAAKGARVCEQVRRTAGNADVHVVDLDLAELASVRHAAAEVLGRWDRLDLLVCNAAHQKQFSREREVTGDGFEKTFGVNHLAHALLISLLEERLRASAPSRVVLVASEAYARVRNGLDLDDLMLTEDYSGWAAYNRSKLANVLFARQLAQHLSGSGVTVAAAHPGGVDTAAVAKLFAARWKRPAHWLLQRLLLLTPEDAAAGLLRVALDANVSGEAYFELGAPARPTPVGRDDVTARRLWDVTWELVGSRPGSGSP